MEYVELTEADLAHRWRTRPVSEYVDAAVSAAAEDDEFATPDSALRWLLELAWDDLRRAQERALGGRWSMKCDGQVSRIVGLTRLVGPLSWRHVSVDLILSGVYERIHESMGNPTPLTDEERQQAQAIRDRQGGN
jgi:hypothetical protein